MKKSIVTLVVLLAMVLTSLPVVGQAQTRRNDRNANTRTQSNEAMGPRVTAQVGTSEYYSDDSVFFKSRKVFVSKVDLQIGGNPQVRGGLKTAPAADEMDIKLDKRILVATMTASNSIYMGYLNPIVNGQQIYVRIKTETEQIIAIINCGNWTRQLDRNYSFKECDKTPGPCVPGETTSKTETAAEEDGSPVTIVTSSDGCTTRIEKTIIRTKIQYEDREVKVEVCKPGSLDPTPLVNISGRVNKDFKVDSAIGQFTPEQQAEIKSKIGMEKIHGLIIFRGACDGEGSVLQVYFFAKKGGKWNWVSFLVGVGVGVVVGYFIKRTKNTPAIKRQDADTILPDRHLLDGSGSTTTTTTGGGGIIGTVPTRPRKP